MNAQKSLAVFQDVVFDWYKPNFQMKFDACLMAENITSDCHYSRDNSILNRNEARCSAHILWWN